MARPTAYSAPTDAASGEPARAEAVAAAALPLLFTVQQFVGRANSVAINLVHQLASLYEPKQRLFAATFRTVTMRRAFDALGELLGMLIAIDDALLRPGRLEQLLHVRPPTAAERADVLALHSEGRPLAADVDIRAVAALADVSPGQIKPESLKHCLL